MAVWLGGLAVVAIWSVSIVIALVRTRWSVGGVSGLAAAMIVMGAIAFVIRNLAGRERG